MIESINGNGPILLKNQGDFLQFLENGGGGVASSLSATHLQFEPESIFVRKFFWTATLFNI